MQLPVQQERVISYLIKSKETSWKRHSIKRFASFNFNSNSHIKDQRIGSDCCC